MSKTLIILGNGFSIDFITKFNDYLISKNKEKTTIDLNNLFSLGDKVFNPWNHQSGFLSFEDCPALWTLGAHPNNSTQEASKLLSDIVTCANMFKNQKDDIGFAKVDQIYLKAYCELISYLKSLFVFYNEQIQDSDIESFLNETSWGWKSFFKNLERAKDTDEYIFVTYNYDIWLERILKSLNIKFSCLNQNRSKNVKIYKPHGSINYCSKDDLSINSYTAHKYSLLDDYKNLIIYEKDMLKYKGILIPPAGVSKNSGQWTNKIRTQVIKKAGELSENDKIILCGISYWFVDRYEIDRLLLSVNPETSLVYINPNPPSELNSVLMIIFKKYKLYQTSDNIGE